MKMQLWEVLLMLLMNTLTAFRVFGSCKTQFRVVEFKHGKNTLLLDTPKMRLYRIRLVVTP